MKGGPAEDYMKMNVFSESQPITRVLAILSFINIFFIKKNFHAKMDGERAK